MNSDTRPRVHRLYRKAYSPYTEWKFLDVAFMKLPRFYDFDFPRLLAQVLEIEKQIGGFSVDLPTGEKIPGYQGFGLTFRQNAIDPAKDAFQFVNADGQYESSSNGFGAYDSILARESIHQFERGFTERSPYLSGYLAEVVGRFRSPITKIRVANLMPGHIVQEHFDFPYYENVRVHACLEGNEDVTWTIEGHEYSIPRDGSFYFFDAGRLHSVQNKGKTLRKVLSIHLSPYVAHDGSRLFGPETDLIEMIRNSRL